MQNHCVCVSKLYIPRGNTLNQKLKFEYVFTVLGAHTSHVNEEQPKKILRIPLNRIA